MGRRQPPAYDAVIMDRRRQVAALRLRSMSIRDIERALPELRCVNPANGQPWSFFTIQTDLKAIEKDWLKETRVSVEKRRAKLDAELEEVKRVGWKDADPNSVLRAIEQQRKMLGVDAPPTLDDDDAPPPVRVVLEVKDASIARPEQPAG